MTRPAAALLLVPTWLTACTSTDGKDTDEPVDPCPIAVVAPESLAFTGLEWDVPGTQSVSVLNDCTGSDTPLTIQASVDDAAFYADPPLASAAPGQVATLTVRAIVGDYDEVAATLTLVTNDPANPTVTVPLTALANPDQDGDGTDAIAAGGADCDDTDATVGPGATETWYDGVDQDCSGDDDDDQDGDGVAYPADCDDTDATRSPDAVERCDGADVDEDCDGRADDADDDVDPASLGTAYADADGDTFGDAGAPILACDTPADAVDDATDCDDTRADVSPAGTETCDAADVDEDCDGLTDDADDSADAASFATFHADADGDGFGDPLVTVGACDTPTGYTPDALDCDDTSGAVSPAAAEVCDAADVDEDCDGGADDADATVDAATFAVFYVDGDGDGYGEAGAPVQACDLPAGAAANDDDCDDGAPATNPAGTEVCGGADEDCDGLSDDDDPSVSSATFATFYADADRDGYGDASATTRACEAPATWLSDARDCDDADAAVSPDAEEDCDNGLDDDCDGATDEVACPFEGDLDAEAGDAVIYGPSAGSYFGYSLDAGYDWDGDGTLGTAVAAPYATYSGRRGLVYLYDGFPSGTTSADAAPAAKLYGPSSLPTSWLVYGVRDLDMDGYDELAIRVDTGSDVVLLYEGEDLGGTAEYDDVHWAGIAGTGPVTSVGDFDGAGGNDELAVANHEASANQGSVLVFTVGTGSLPMLVTINGEDPGDVVGYVHGLAGGPGNDTNGDGVDDLFVAAVGDDTSGTNAGAVYVVTGPVTGTLDLADAALKIVGRAAGDEFGYAVNAPGDTDGDGRADLLLAARHSDENGTSAGSAYLFRDVDSDGASPDIDTTDYDVRLLGEAAGDVLGDGRVHMGDVNGDGDLDLLVGSSDSVYAGDGAAWLLYGPLSGSYDLSVGEYDARFGGGDTGDDCGRNVALADLDADGDDDLVIPCDGGDAGSYSGYGTVSFFAGR